jgi:hypothetical protein
LRSGISLLQATADILGTLQVHVSYLGALRST